MELPAPASHPPLHGDLTCGEAIRGAFTLLVLAPFVYGVFYPQPYLNQIPLKILFRQHRS